MVVISENLTHTADVGSTRIRTGVIGIRIQCDT